MKLAGIAEVAAIAGVSKSRAHQLAQKASFPAPLDRIASGPVWRRRDVERWVAERDARHSSPVADVPIT